MSVAASLSGFQTWSVFIPQSSVNLSFVTLFKDSSVGRLRTPALPIHHFAHQPSASLCALSVSALSLVSSLYFLTPLLHYFLSVMPLLRILSPRIFLHMLRHPLHKIRIRSRLPPMTLHRPSILKIAIARRIRQLLHFLFQLVHRQVQVKIVHVADVHMNL